MGKRGATRAFVPPQRLEGESKEHYLRNLAMAIENWRKIRDDQHNTRELRKKARHRMHKCTEARDRCLTGREK